MRELDQQKPKRPGTAFAGFVVPFTLMVSVALTYQGQLFWDIGWRGGEYAYVFIGVATGAILVGGVLRLLQPQSPWRSFGSGMVVAGTLGVVLAIVITALVMIALSHLTGGRS